LAFSSIFAHFAVLLQPPVLDLEPRSLDFRDQDIGMASSPQTVTLKNNLAAGLDISAIAITGTDAADFTEANDCPISPATLAPGGSCIITVTFAPSTIGAMTAAVTISNNDPGSPQQTVNLTGNGINPIVTLSATSLSFSSQPVSTTSAAQPVTVTNSGTTPLIVSGITTSGDFEQTNNCPVPPTLAVSAACTINVTFTPTAGGTVTGTLTITDNALSSPQTVSLTGVGVPPAVTLSATDLMFGSYAIGVPSSLQTVTVTNNGPGPLAVTKVTTSGAFSQTNNCVGTVAALANCTINVTYTPTASGPQAGFLTITDNAVASPQTVSLTGTGVSPTATASP